MGATEFITREGAELMFTQLLADYEKEKVEPRHRETQASLRELLMLAARRKGWLDVGKTALALTGIFWTCIEIWRALR